MSMLRTSLMMILATLRGLSFTIVRFTSSNTHYFLLSNGVAKEIEDVETLSVFGYAPNQCNDISLDFLNEFHRGHSIGMIRRENATPDEIMRVELLKIHALQEKLMYDVTTFCSGCKNPSAIIWQGRPLLCAEFGFKKDYLLFAWFNMPLFNNSNEASQFGISTSYGDIEGRELQGNDCRMFNTQDGGFVASFSTEKVWPTRVGFAEVQLVHNPDSNGSAVYTKTYPHIPPDSDHIQRQKNWAPFLYNESFYFVQRINPLRVMHIVPDPDPEGTVLAATLSIAEHVPLPWQYGELRGGTNAVLVSLTGEEDFYLAFFHSIAVLADSGRNTYFCGAYTFSAQPPFKLLSMSPHPIVDDSLYTGPWFSFHGLHVDYVVYPTSFFIHENKEVVLFFGHNDVTGYHAKLNLQLLLNSLVALV